MCGKWAAMKDKISRFCDVITVLSLGYILSSAFAAIV